MKLAGHKRHQGAGQSEHDGKLEALHAFAAVILLKEVDVLLRLRGDFVPYFRPPRAGHVVRQGQWELGRHVGEVRGEHSFLDAAVWVDDVLAVGANEVAVVKDAQPEVVRYAGAFACFLDAL